MAHAFSPSFHFPSQAARSVLDKAEPVVSSLLSPLLTSPVISPACVKVSGHNLRPLLFVDTPLCASSPCLCVSFLVSHTHCSRDCSQPPLCFPVSSFINAQPLISPPLHFTASSRTASRVLPHRTALVMSSSASSERETELLVEDALGPADSVPAPALSQEIAQEPTKSHTTAYNTPRGAPTHATPATVASKGASNP